jgi:hypothetical protein
MWKVGPLQSVNDGYGFNIVDNRSRPVATFNYETTQEAVDVHELMARGH